MTAKSGPPQLPESIWRSAAERGVNSRLDVSYAFQRHFVRGWKKMGFVAGWRSLSCWRWP